MLDLTVNADGKPVLNAPCYMIYDLLYLNFRLVAEGEYTTELTFGIVGLGQEYLLDKCEIQVLVSLDPTQVLIGDMFFQFFHLRIESGPKYWLKPSNMADPILKGVWHLGKSENTMICSPFPIGYGAQFQVPTFNDSGIPTYTVNVTGFTNIGNEYFNIDLVSNLTAVWDIDCQTCKDLGLPS